MAAGEGSRMLPLTSSRPKVMLPAGGKPFIEHLVQRASKAGVTEIILVVGYRSESIKDMLKEGDGLGTKIRYAFQKEQRGTGHALMAAAGMTEDQFLVLNGDVLTDVLSLSRMAVGEGLAVAAKKVAHPSRYGVFEVEEGSLKSVTEKSRSPPSDLANAGIYRLDKRVFDALREIPLSERGEYELTDLLNILVSRGEDIRMIEIDEWIEIGRPWDILKANESLLDSGDHAILGEVEPNAFLHGRISVGSGTRIRSGSYIQGPVSIGKNCDIGPNCFIRPYTSIGDNVRIGSAVEIKNSTIMESSNVAHLSYVGDSIIGSHCNFGAGTIVANLRHDDGEIRSYIKDKKVNSERRKLGVIMGDDVKTGINTTIYPGTVIETGYTGRPGEALRGRITATISSLGPECSRKRD